MLVGLLSAVRRGAPSVRSSRRAYRGPQCQRERRGNRGFDGLYHGDGARAASYDVPPAIIGKLVETPPDRAAWLTPSDLASMDVVTIDTAKPSGTSSPTPAPAPQYYGALPSPDATPANQPAPSEAFKDGLTDRRTWETWFAGLAGSSRMVRNIGPRNAAYQNRAPAMGQRDKTSVTGRLVAWPQNRSLLPQTFAVNRNLSIELAGTAIR